MAKKNIYLYKVVISNTESKKEIELSNYRATIKSITSSKNANNALRIDLNESEPMVMDIIEDNDEYLFARLSKKKPNNTMLKRDYKTLKTAEVLAPDELKNNGIEVFTYCILGYTHGILSIVNAQGAPHTEAFSQLFAIYKPEMSLDTIGIPNSDLIKELCDGKSPEINRIHFDMVQPSPKALEQVFGFNDEQLLGAIGQNTSSLVVDIKPDLRGNLLENKTLICKLIALLSKNQARFSSIKISGRQSSKAATKEYDLYSTFFKYQIDIKETRQRGGRKVEVDKETLQKDYRSKMMNVYNFYKQTLLLVSDRIPK